jgi:hypothetical protein
MSDSHSVTNQSTPVPEFRASVRIRYCTQCRWLMRAQWLAGELLTTFPLELEVTLEPGRCVVARGTTTLCTTPNGLIRAATLVRAWD